MTVLEVLQISTEFLRKHEIENARLNAEHLLAHLLGRTRMELYLEFERNLAETDLKQLRDLIKRRSRGEPLQHLLGTVEFCGHVFKIDKRAMVPRPETEQLVELVIADCETRRPGRIVDIGTGSGIIALSLGKEFPNADILAVDISEDALALARENAERLDLAGRISFKKGDLLEEIAERFDLIVANLPYLSMQERPSLSREVLHDPEIALFGGEGGDELIRELINQSPTHLNPGGLLALEIGVGQSDGLETLLRQKNLHDIDTKKDYSGIPRFLFARYG
ncbi:MAG TPA: peptide chain release factor N(5)-glutamine methyltransferase [Chthoniobacterales bacterium]|nr:peptide chain release factor N(5)-glutamine methyltransferase [Chthoniobacterales bacterium]